MSYDATVLADSPLLYYRCNDASGNLSDASGNSNTGTVTPTVSYSQAALTPYLAASSISCDSSGYATSGATWAANLVTVEAWINLNATDLATSVSLIGNWWGPVQSSGGFDLTIEDGTPKFYYGARTLNGASALTAGLYHIVGVWDGTNAYLYINGAQNATSSLTPVGNVYTPNSASPYIYVGSIYTVGGIGYQSSSDISNVALYPTGLSAARVHAHYQAGIGLPQAGPMVDAPRPTQRSIAALLATCTVFSAPFLASYGKPVPGASAYLDRSPLPVVRSIGAANTPTTFAAPWLSSYAAPTPAVSGYLQPIPAPQTRTVPAGLVPTTFAAPWLSSYAAPTPAVSGYLDATPYPARANAAAVPCVFAYPYQPPTATPPFSAFVSSAPLAATERDPRPAIPVASWSPWLSAYAKPVPGVSGYLDATPYPARANAAAVPCIFAYPYQPVIPARPPFSGFLDAPALAREPNPAEFPYVFAYPYQPGTVTLPPFSAYLAVPFVTATRIVVPSGAFSAPYVIPESGYLEPRITRASSQTPPASFGPPFLGQSPPGPAPLPSGFEDDQPEPQTHPVLPALVPTSFAPPYLGASPPAALPPDAARYVEPVPAPQTRTVPPALVPTSFAVPYLGQSPPSVVPPDAGRFVEPVPPPQVRIVSSALVPVAFVPPYLGKSPPSAVPPDAGRFIEPVPAPQVRYIPPALVPPVAFVPPYLGKSPPSAVPPDAGRYIEPVPAPQVRYIAPALVPPAAFVPPFLGQSPPGPAPLPSGYLDRSPYPQTYPVRPLPDISFGTMFLPSIPVETIALYCPISPAVFVTFEIS